MLTRFKNLSKVELVLIGLAAVTLVTSVALHSTYQELFFSDRVSGEDAIARVISSTSDTRRRAPDSFEFHKLKSNTTLGNGDFVYSGENSQITVKFDSGTRILIGEQSLVVLREVNGTPDLLIEQGAISGSFEDDGEVEIQTKQEAVILNGEKDAQFYVSYLRGGGLEIGSIERRIQLEFNGEKVDLVKQKARVSKDSGIEVQEKPSNDPTVTVVNKDSNTPPASTPQLPAGLEVNDEEMKNRITLTPPYPQVGHIFVHSTGGKIPVFPKVQCQGACEIRLSVNGKPAVSKKFDRDMVPFFFLTVQADIEAEITWEFSDGTDLTKGNFEVLKNNEVSFQKAFDSKRPIEVMN